MEAGLRSHVVLTVATFLLGALPIAGSAQGQEVELCPAVDEAARLPWVFGDDFESAGTCAWSDVVGGFAGSCGACGDRIVDPVTEQCDDGNNDDEDGCRTDCLYNVCGDGVVNTGVEECDDFGAVTATCNRDCTQARCGDSIVNPSYTAPLAPGPEQCDDGNEVDTDGCRNNCRYGVCGDGVVGPGEECDGSGASTATCNRDCTTAACGDFVLNPLFIPQGELGPEQCDDGNTDAGDGCSPTCQFEACGG